MNFYRKSDGRDIFRSKDGDLSGLESELYELDLGGNKKEQIGLL